MVIIDAYVQNAPFSLIVDEPLLVDAYKRLSIRYLGDDNDAVAARPSSSSLMEGILFAAPADKLERQLGIIPAMNLSRGIKMSVSIVRLGDGCVRLTLVPAT